MKKLIIAITTLLGFTCFSQTQNLVPNGSFESFNNCPSNYGQVYEATGWQKSLTNNTGPTTWDHTDYFHNCAPLTPGFSTPLNTWGNQAPADGNAYVGMTTMYNHNGYGPNYRENIYIQLSQALSVGTPYYVSFQASLADYFGKASDRLGIKLSTVPNFDINNFAHVFSTTPITNKTGWVTVQGIVMADSAYSYLGLGNFFKDALTNEITVPPPGAYSANLYYIDNVKIYKVCEWVDSLNTDTIIDHGRHSNNSSSSNNSNKISNSISSDNFLCYPSPTKTSLTIRYNVSDVTGNFSIELLNKEGQLMKESYIGIKTSNLSTIEISDLPAGIYICNLRRDGSVIKSQKVIKE